jgi:hypothetical protein
VIETHPAKVNVVHGFLAAGEREVTVKNGIALDVFDEFAAGVRHEPRLPA